MPIKPQVYDFVAYYEPRADFSLSARIRKAIKELGRRYGRPTWMAGAHAGRPAIYTDMHGISIGARIEISRLIWKPESRRARIAEVFEMFTEAARQGITSGPISRMTVRFRGGKHSIGPRLPVREAFEAVFGSTCCFQVLTTDHRYLHMHIGRAVVHQTLLQHLREGGPYHSTYLPRIERVQNELDGQPDRYEGYHYFVKPFLSPEGWPEVDFCYSGHEPARPMEATLLQRTGEQLRFIPESEVEIHSDQFVSLTDYELGARRFGALWIMQQGLIRQLDREYLPLLYLFMDDSGHPMPDRAFNWQELFERQRKSQYVPQASRASGTFLDMGIEHMLERDLIMQEGGNWCLHPGFSDVLHVTYYELGQYDKRLA
uniref:Uncharacterized protein n=1 Tax=Candidatus Kentrum sp. DK TaxID=2126562 RepID=A0A450TFC8_9GAMM|nr:MAG: hypothetical protein BECKDK2373C_GA0170839_11291 [Candidatus Kentron sp. DK]VFJ65921.1 MAG: hypothetical protein BECKDK2373B_GA0170837_11561 [Candidatus Kentron sp. DK]